MTSIPYSVGKLIDGARDRVRRLKIVRGGGATAIVWLLALVAAMVVDSRIVIFDDRIRYAMTAGVWLLALVAAFFFLAVPLWRRDDFRRMARRIDAKHPEFEERVSTLVELAESDSRKLGFSEALFAMVGDLAERDVATVDLKRDFPGRRALAVLAVALGILLALLIGVAVSPDVVGRLALRSLAPWMDIGNVFAKDIAVKPGDVVALSGSVIRIEASPAKKEAALFDAVAVGQRSEVRGQTADVSSFHSNTQTLKHSNTIYFIRISRRTASGWTPETSEPMVGGVYSTTADLNEREWRYRVTAGAAVTRHYRVRVSEKPRYERFTARVEYPAYTRCPALVVSNEDVAAIRAIHGSKVTFDLKLPDETLADFRIAGEPVREYAMTSNRTDNWSLQLVNRDGFRSDFGKHPLSSYLDQPPTVVVEKPKGTLRLPPHAKIPVEITASDDLGVANVYLRVSIDGEPWANHYGTAIEDPANRKLYRTVADVDLSLYDLVFAKNIRFDVVVEDGCTPDFGGPHAVTSTPFAVEFNLDVQNYALQELKKEVEVANRDLGEAFRRLNDAQRLAEQVRDELKRDAKPSEATEKKSERLAHEIAEAEKRLAELRAKFDDDERFEPLVKPMDRLLEKALQPVLEQVEKAQFREKNERAEEMDRAVPELKEAAQAMDDLTKRLNERAKAVDEFEKVKDLADRQEALARTAKDILAERPTDTAKLEAWKRLEEAALRKAQELSRNETDADFDEAKRKMESAAREMAALKREIEEDKANATDEKRLAASREQRAKEATTRADQALRQALQDQQRACDALKAAANATNFKDAERLEAQAEAAQRAAEDQLERGDLGEALQAMQKAATDAARAAAEAARKAQMEESKSKEEGESKSKSKVEGKSPVDAIVPIASDQKKPSSSDAFETNASTERSAAEKAKTAVENAVAAQQAAMEAAKGEQAMREAIGKGEKQLSDLNDLEKDLMAQRLAQAEERAQAARTAAEAALQKAKAAIGEEETAALDRLADAALDARRDAVAAEEAVAELKDDEAAAEALGERERTLDRLADAGEAEEAREDRILSRQREALEALKRGDRNRAMNLQRDVAKEQERAAEAVMGEADAEAAREQANDAQDAASAAAQKANRQWNNDTQAAAVKAQEAAIAREQAAQEEVRTLRAMGAIGAAEGEEGEGQRSKVKGQSPVDAIVPIASDQKKESSSDAFETNASTRDASTRDASTASQQAPVKSAGEAAKAMEREVKNRAAALGMSGESKSESSEGGGKGRKDEDDGKKSVSGGGIDEEVSKLAKELKRNDGGGFFRSLFSRKGWFKIGGADKNLSDRDLRDIPPEYRELVRRYFLKLSEE